MKNGLEKFYNLVESFEKLPSIGKKTALRLAYYIVNESSYVGVKLAHNIESAIASIRKCTKCNGISEHEICEICLDKYRTEQVLCIVQDAKDMFIIEGAKHFNGKYYVVDTLDDEIINGLIETLRWLDYTNILFAVTPSLANDAFILMIEDKINNHFKNDKDKVFSFSKIAQGVPTGVSLENIDTLSLTKAIDGKTTI